MFHLDRFAPGRDGELAIALGKNALRPGSAMLRRTSYGAVKTHCLIGVSGRT